jgi:hypothetical protein
MKDVHVVLGALAVGLNGAAGAWGAWRWWRVEDSRAFWRILRAGQGVLVVQVALGGLLVALGHKPHGSLHYLYGLLPLAVYFIAEQLRVSAAESVLQARGLEDAAAVGRLPEGEQRSVVVAILRRELGVLSLAAVVVVVLTLRAASVAGGF